MVIGILACQASAIMFQENIAKSYFIRKKSNKDIEDKAESIKDIFTRIKLSKYEIILDNLISLIFYPCSCLRPIKKLPCFKRKRLLQKCEDRF